MCVCAPAVGSYCCVTAECRAYFACCNASNRACNAQAILERRIAFMIAIKFHFVVTIMYV